jgi:defect-in-organelle-trafficking protein DotD
MKFIKLTLLVAVLALAGCSDSKRVVDLHLKYITADSAPLNSQDSNAQAQVADASTSVSGSLQELSAIDMANTPTSKQKKIGHPFNPRVTGMTQLASIDWNGPVLPILKKLASATGYRVRVLGVEPSIPVLVLVNAQNQPIADIVRNVMYQVHNKAAIKIYPKSHVIELRYYKS